MSLGLTDSQYYSDIADAIREKTGSEAELAPSEMSAAISEISTKFPTSNLWGGLQMAIDLDKAGLSSAAPADNYISLTGSYTMTSRTAIESIFKENTQYTCILAYENNSAYSGGNITANLAFSYSDGTTDNLVIPNSTADTKYTHAFVSAEGKTVTKIICAYIWETAKIYYNESGVFEGVKTVEDFEPYNRYGIPYYCDFCNEYIELPFALNANHKVFVDYELPEYINQLQILGNTTGAPSSFYHGLYGDRFYVYTDSGEHNWSTSGITVEGRHTLIVNDSGRVVFDGVDKMAGTPNTDQNVHYTIGYRGASFEFIGKIYRFYIYDTVNDEYLCDLMPIWDSEHNRTALKDIINDIVYTPSKWV